MHATLIAVICIYCSNIFHLIDRADGFNSFVRRRSSRAHYSRTLTRSKRWHPSPLDDEDNCKYIIFVVHGVGASSASLHKNIDLFRDTMEYVASEAFPSESINTHIELINWKSDIVREQENLLVGLRPQSPARLERVREMLGSAFSDIASFMIPERNERLVSNVVGQMNSIFADLVKTKKFKNSKIAIVGYSLGSLICHDILSEDSLAPRLSFKVDKLFLWGSPLSPYLRFTEKELKLNVTFYNIYHPLDPMAFRLEPLTDCRYKPAIQIDRKSWGKRLPPKRLDFALQSTNFCSLIFPFLRDLEVCTSHMDYWKNKDLCSFILNILRE